MTKRPLVSVALSMVLATGVEAQDRSYRPGHSAANGRQLYVVLVTAAYCSDSQRTDYKRSVEQLKILLRDQAERRTESFSISGVAVDWSAEEGLSHLRDLGHFDQLFAGGGWTGLATNKVLDFPPRGEVTTPQVILIRRTIAVGRGSVRIANERVIQRIVGVDHIVRWVAEGAPIS